ncbi:hypothetical protein ACES2L_05975 [Bdellovibrio bacteriovorus]
MTTEKTYAEQWLEYFKEALEAVQENNPDLDGVSQNFAATNIATGRVVDPLIARIRSLEEKVAALESK